MISVFLKYLCSGVPNEKLEYIIMHDVYINTTFTRKMI